jgi:pimeloyl-ACP methyl ester carboxylesterase
MAFAWHSIAAGGDTLRYAEAGAGPALIVIDGIGGRRPSPAHALLAESRRVLVFALPEDETAAVQARRIGAVLDALNIRSFDLMGHGLGAAATLHLALERKAAARALCLVAPLALAAPELGALAPAALHAHPERHPDPPVLHAGRARALLGDPGEIERRMAEIAQPVLALFGIDDPLAPPEQGGRYRAALKTCNLMFVYDAAHLIDLDRPEAVAFIAGEFLGRHDQFLVSREDGRAFP